MARTLPRVMRRLRYGRPVVVVSGLPRSGTSMAMKMLAAGGVALVVDNIRTADEDNPKGYYELERVKDLEKDPDRSWLKRARGKAVKVISFLLKDLPPENSYRIIFMHRDLEEVLASQAKMLERRGESSDTSDEDMLALWRSHLEKAAFLIRYRPWLEALDVAYRDVLSDPRREAERINDFLGGSLDVEQMVSVVDENLYRNRAKKLAG